MELGVQDFKDFTKFRRFRVSQAGFRSVGVCLRPGRLSVAGRLLAENLGLRYSHFSYYTSSCYYRSYRSIQFQFLLTLDFGKLARFQVCEKTYSGIRVSTALATLPVLLLFGVSVSVKGLQKDNWWFSNTW